MPAGNGRWGHVDLAGSIEEWTFDWYADTYYEQTGDGCSDCANLEATSVRAIRSGIWDDRAGSLRSAFRTYYNPDDFWVTSGIRCARSAP